jgi:uncharacterized protein (TIGR03067 family)
MRPLFCASAFIAATFAVGNALSGTETKDSAKSLDGTWQCIGLAGFAGPESDDIVKKIKITIAGPKMTFTIGDMTNTGKIKTDFTKNPVEIDIVMEDGPAKGKIHLGALVLKGDELIIRYANSGNERPGDVTYGESSTDVLKYSGKTTVIVLKRIK